LEVKKAVLMAVPLANLMVVPRALKMVAKMVAPWVSQ
jgi:hypothetical protein